MSAADTSKLLAAGPWREVPRRLAALWRRSLQFRTVLITLGLSGHTSIAEVDRSALREV